MKFLILVLITYNIFADNYKLQYHLRSSSLRADRHIFKVKEKSNWFDLNTTANITTNAESLIEVTQEKDQEIIFDYLSKNYGKTTSLYAKESFKFYYPRVTHEISSQVSAILAVNNPIFPEINATIFHDYSTSLSVNMFYNDYEIIPKITAGQRKYLPITLYTSDFINKTAKFEFKETPYKLFTEAGIAINKDNYYLEINSIPLIGDFPVKYWNTRLGTKLNYKIIKFDLSLSPLYYGTYDWKRTVRAIISLDFFISPSLSISNKTINYGLNFNTRLVELGAYYSKENFTYSNEETVGVRFSLGF